MTKSVDPGSQRLVQRCTEAQSQQTDIPRRLKKTQQPEKQSEGITPRGCHETSMHQSTRGVVAPGRDEKAVDRLGVNGTTTLDTGEKVTVCDSTTEDIEAQERPDDTRKSASTFLVEIALDQYNFGRSTMGEAFVTPKSGSKVVRMLRGGKCSLRAELARKYLSQRGKVPSQQALTDALMVLEGLAQEADEEELRLRVCELACDIGQTNRPSTHELWLDMGDPTGRAVRITSDGWRIEPEAPVLFKRTVLMESLPEPERGGSLNELWRWLNVEEADESLLIAWLVGALFPEISHPILSFFGEQGTGKTTAQKILVSVLDPSPVATRKPPRNAESWVTAAAGSWLVGLDNLSTVPDWLSDSLCRAVTGDADVRRKLYTDNELAVFAFRRCVCLTSIDLGAVRGDLEERMLPITLNIIPDEKRLAETDIWPAWRQAHPRILGALLDVASKCLAALPHLELTCKPRMADFARIVAAVDHVLGTEGLHHYLGKQSTMAAESLDGDPFITALSQIDSFEGTAAELLDKITPVKPPKCWPANARAATQHLRRQAPVMRKSGWQIADDGGKNKAGTVRWSTTPPDKARISSPPAPSARQTCPESRLAGKAGNENGISLDDPEQELEL